ncbi:MAG: sugar ABC transporter ATP-binding protein, partial [Sphingomonadales bacterium]
MAFVGKGIPIVNDLSPASGHVPGQASGASVTPASSVSDSASTKPILELRGVSKRYGGVAALTGVDFAAWPGTIHAVLGENGAGKSTLIKIASGVTDPSDGDVYVDGRKVSFRNPVQAMAAGVVCVFQELSLIPDMT